MTMVQIGDFFYYYDDAGRLSHVVSRPFDQEPQSRPTLPAEVWHTQEFNADRAHDALLALCKGN